MDGFPPRARDAAGSVRRSRASLEPLVFALERVKGIEPSYSAWKAAALPLSYTREARVSPASGPAHAWRRTYKASPRSVKATWRPFPAIAWFRPFILLMSGLQTGLVGFLSDIARGSYQIVSRETIWLRLTATSIMPSQDAKIVFSAESFVRFEVRRMGCT